ncbi:MAG: hypothetical protein VX899_09445 [Myxococcota bacterium]|nr:hypothetical protein [Myxococcota bacterium]
MPLLLLLACAPNPSAATEYGGVAPEGLPVKVHLWDIDSATLAGQTVTHGQTITIPRSAMQTGRNTWTLGGDFGENPPTVNTTIGVAQALMPSCEGGEATVMDKGDRGFIETECPIVDGAIQVTVDPLPGLSVEGEGVVLTDDALRIPFAHLALDAPLTTKSSFGLKRVALELPVVVKSPDGEPLSATLKASFRGSPMGAFFSGLPGTLQGLSAPTPDPKVAVFRTGEHFWSAGPADGLNLREADLFVAIAAEGTPKPFKDCVYSSIDGISGSFIMPTELVPVTYVAYDRAGNERARTTLTASGCPSATSYAEGQTLRVHPGDGQVRAWVQTLVD